MVLGSVVGSGYCDPSYLYCCVPFLDFSRFRSICLGPKLVGKSPVEYGTRIMSGISGVGWCAVSADGCRRACNVRRAGD